MNLSAVIFMILTFLGAVLLSVRMFDTNPERLEPERDALLGGHPWPSSGEPGPDLGKCPNSRELDLDKARPGYSLWCCRRCEEEGLAWLGWSWKASQWR